MGETGSGKSTIGKSILRLIGTDGRILAGEILLQGEEVSKMPEKIFASRRGRVIATIPQNPYLALDPVMRCGKQVEEVFMLEKKFKKSQVREKVISLFTDVKLDDPERIYRSYPHMASIGELQRVCVAMAIAASPKLLIADEPFSSVDSINRLLLADLFWQVASQRDIGILLITHKIELVDKLADRWYLLHHGKIVESGVGGFSSAALSNPYAQKVAADHAAMKSVNKISNPPDETLFELVDLSVTFSTKTFFGLRKQDSKAAIKRVSFKVNSREILGIVGRSGSGKSTLAKVMGGLLTTYDGNAFFRSNEINRWVQSNRRSYYSQVQYLMQDAGASLPPRRKTGNVIVDTLNAFHPSSRSQQHDKALELLASVELGQHFFGKRRDELSGGEQQRVSIARALAAQPAALILDESLNSLDKPVQRQIIDLLRSLQSQYELTIILISHDLSLISHFCTRTVVLNQGEIAEIGATFDVVNSPRASITKDLIRAQG